MDLKKLGSDWGGAVVDLDLIQDGDLIVDVGVGRDATFAEALDKLRQGLRFRFVDPDIRSEKTLSSTKIDNYEFFLGAVAPDKDPVKVSTGKGSFSLFEDHANVQAETIFSDPVKLSKVASGASLLKFDAEGAEYLVAREIADLRLKQVNLEFHDHRVKRFRKSDTDRVVNLMLDAGYGIAHRRLSQYLFVLVKN